jgi:hypothetical protein
MADPTVSFDHLFQLYSWKEIPNCPGRYVLSKQDHRRLETVTPTTILDNQVPVEIFASEVCRDRVHVAKFLDGGLLSYEKSDGTFVHTLNNLSGLARKMKHLNIQFTARVDEK